MAARQRALQLQGDIQTRGVPLFARVSSQVAAHLQLRTSCRSKAADWPAKKLNTSRTREWLVPELNNDDPSTLIKGSTELTTELFLATLVLCGASLHLIHQGMSELGDSKWELSVSA